MVSLLSGSGMSKLREEYLLKAAEADVSFRAAKGRETIAAWERIVVGYLELAEIELQKTLGLQS